MPMSGLFEQWPRRLPSWLARRALQVMGVAVVMPVAVCAIHVWPTAPGATASACCRCSAPALRLGAVQPHGRDVLSVSRGHLHLFRQM